MEEKINKDQQQTQPQIWLCIKLPIRNAALSPPRSLANTNIE